MPFRRTRSTRVGVRQPVEVAITRQDVVLEDDAPMKLVNMKQGLRCIARPGSCTLLCGWN